ncbi:MAG: hypothetical protein FVQ79_00640 [Planctomycetes bacterium]|nr:hypothetical protein [Planctomycetota bacterium]
MNENTDSYFLKYQLDWIRDQRRFKIWEKSRRIGATYAQSYEDVVDASRQNNPIDIWFTSADLSAAQEYIRYCEQWTKLFKHAAHDLGEIIIDSDNDIRALAIEFANGKRIHALSSNPKAFRSKGGKLVIDEYAYHGDAESLWKAALPIITWGFPVRILSTYNGKGNRYYRMVSDARKGNRWSLHSTTIEDAVDAGLAEKIIGQSIIGRVSESNTKPELEALLEQISKEGDDIALRVLSGRIEQALAKGEDARHIKQSLIHLQLNAADRQAWLDEQKDACGDEETWQQEYMCQPVDEATAWLTWDLITGVEHEDAGKPELYQGGDCYAGIDIGRRNDLFVIEVDELVGDTLWTREVVRMKNASFAAQDAELDRVFGQYNIRRACMDQTGMGEKPVEDAKRRHGEYKVEGIIFSGPVKQHLATIIKQKYEDKLLRTPVERAYRESHHAVRKMTTVAGNPRFDADHTEAGHADEFWAHSLALHAAEDVVQPAAGVSVESDDDVYLPDAMRNRRRLNMGNRLSNAGRGHF